MRLVLACIVLFLVPAGCLFVTDRMVTGLEQDFQEDAHSQIARLDRIAQMNPPRLRTMRNAPAIQQLKRLAAGNLAAGICAREEMYRRVFDLVAVRCGRWDLLRRARVSALLAVIGTVFAFSLILMARITVNRYDRRRRWPGNWTLWFVVRGIHGLLALQAAGSLVSAGILLHSVIARTAVVVAALILPFAALYWLERRVILAFVEPQRLRVYKVRGVQGRPQR